MPRCADCRFYAAPPAQAGKDEAGNCRRSPPRAFPVQVQTLQGIATGMQGVFPPITANEWCGEFMPKSPGLASI